MANISKNNLGAIGDYQVLSRLLLLGYQAANINMAVNNMKNVDLFCQDSTGRYTAIQVKTTRAKDFNVGITHDKFYDSNGNIDLAAGLKYLETKITCPWVMVNVDGPELNPSYRFFILSRQQVIKMIYESEKWYLTDYFKRSKKLSGNGGIYLSQWWLLGHGVPANHNHKEWVNPFSGNSFEEQWQNLWIN